METGFAISAQMMVLVCALVGFAGFVDAAAGGGGTISLPAYIMTGMPAHMALGCNKFSGSCGTTLAVAQFWKGRAVDVRAALLAAFGSFLGSSFGAWLALNLSDHTIKTLLVFILPCAAAIISTNRGFGDADAHETLSKTKYTLCAFFIGMLIGGYDGLFGPGTGTFAIMAFALIMKYDLKKASGNAKILNLASNYASLVPFAISGNVIYSIAIPAALCGIAGNYLGAKCALTKGAKFIRPMMLVVLALLIAKIVYDLIG